MAYQYFKAALSHWLNQKGNSRKVLQIEAGFKKSLLSQLLSKKREKPISYENQVKIAKGCGFDYLSFLQFGKALLEEEVPLIPLKEKQPSLTKNFRDKDRAIRIIKKLAQAEQLNEAALDKIESQIDLELKYLEKTESLKKKTVNGQE